MSIIIPVLKEPTDGLQRTDWQEPASEPTIPGPYECATGGGHVFSRKWDGASWRNSISGEASSVQLPWRGVKPGSISLERYDVVSKSFIQMDVLKLQTLQD